MAHDIDLRDRAVFLTEATAAFDELRVNVSVRRRKQGDWFTVHRAPTMIDFEFDHGVERARWAYNAKMFRRAARADKAVIGQHAGLLDWFVPVGAGWGDLVAGPVARSWPQASDLVERWRRLTGTQARITSPGFAEYVSATLSTLTLAGSLFEDFRALLVCIGELMSKAATPEALIARIAVLRGKLSSARLPERMWEAAATMVDERTTLAWTSDARGDTRLSLGVRRLPSHVVVGLLLGRRDADPIEDVLQREALQRACAAYAAKRGGMVCGRIGNHGVSLLVDDSGSGPRVRSKLVDLAQRIAGLARRFGFRLHAGVSDPADPRGVPARHQAALAAAESALSQGVSLVRAEPRATRRGAALGELRGELVKALLESPSRLPTLVDRYLEAAAVRTGYRLEPTRTHLEAAFESMVAALTTGSALEAKGVDELTLGVENSADNATTVRDLLAVYRRAALDLAEIAARPTAARRDRSMRRVEQYVREHLDEPLHVRQVARLSGYAPSHFSELFQRANGATFAAYLLGLRMRRAEHLLVNTTLDLDRIAQLSGLRRRQHLIRVFLRETGHTPSHLRRTAMA